MIADPNSTTGCAQLWCFNEQWNKIASNLLFCNFWILDLNRWTRVLNHKHHRLLHNVGVTWIRYIIHGLFRPGLCLTNTVVIRKTGLGSCKNDPRNVGSSLITIHCIMHEPLSGVIFLAELWLHSLLINSGPARRLKSSGLLGLPLPCCRGQASSDLKTNNQIQWRTSLEKTFNRMNE